VSSDFATLSAVVEVEEGVVFGSPARIGPSERFFEFGFARTVTLFGVVRDLGGAGVSGARLHLAEPRSEGHGSRRLESRLLASTDASGTYRAEVRRGWPAGTHLVAVAGSRVPASMALDNVRSSVVQLDLQFTAGAAWRLRVLDEEGRGVSRCRLRVMTSESPLLEGWIPDEVPEGAGGDVGLVSLRGETDEHGVATIEGWPADRPARVRIFDEQSRRFRPAAEGSDSTAPALVVVDTYESNEVKIHVRVERRLVVRVTGQLAGFSSGEVDRLRLTRIGSDGGNEMTRLRQLDQGRFEATLSLWSSDQEGLVRLTLVATMEGSEWRQELGSHELLGAPVLEGVLLRR
jgi:hypothetical protein